MIRKGRRLDERVILIRGGRLKTPTELLEKILDGAEENAKTLEISVWFALPEVDESEEDTILRVCQVGTGLPQAVIQIAHSDALRAAGFSVLPGYCLKRGVWHGNVEIPRETFIEDAARLISVFNEPRKNPSPGGKSEKRTNRF